MDEPMRRGGDGQQAADGQERSKEVDGNLETMEAVQRPAQKGEAEEEAHVASSNVTVGSVRAEREGGKQSGSPVRDDPQSGNRAHTCWLRKARARGQCRSNTPEMRRARTLVPVVVLYQPRKNGQVEARRPTSCQHGQAGQSRKSWAKNARPGPE